MTRMDAPAPGFSFRTKATIVVTLLFATILNYLDRQTISILAPTLQRQMGFNNEHLGWLFAAFYYSYTLFQFAVGPVLDRFNLRWCFAFAVIGWSLVSGLTGLATGFTSLLIFRFLLGVVESANWPAGLQVLARLLPAEERTLGCGIFDSGAAIGALIAPAAIYFLLAKFGWRAAFVGVGVLSLLWSPIWLRVTRSKELSPLWTRRSSQGGGLKPLLSLYKSFARNPRFWWIFVISITVNPSFYFTMNWLPTYFVQDRKLLPGAHLAGILTMIFFALDVGSIGGGACALWLARRNGSVATARRAVFVVATALVSVCAVVPFVTTSTGVVLALISVNTGLGVWNAIYLTMAQEVSPDHVSTVAGTLSAFGSLVGAFAMWAVGRVTDSTGGFAIPMMTVTVAILAACFAAWMASRPAEAAEV